VESELYRKITRLVFGRSQFAITSLLRQGFGLCRDGGEALGANILDDGGNETGGCRNSDGDIRLLIPIEPISELKRRKKRNCPTSG
jgi:hypothetical protein